MHCSIYEKYCKNCFIYEMIQNSIVLLSSPGSSLLSTVSVCWCLVELSSLQLDQTLTTQAAIEMGGIMQEEY